MNKKARKEIVDEIINFAIDELVDRREIRDSKTRSKLYRKMAREFLDLADAIEAEKNQLYESI